MSQTPIVINRIMECLQKQKECYAQLLIIAQRQQQAIDEKSDPDLLKALQDKNPVLQTLQDIDAEMQPILNSLSDADRKLTIQKSSALKDEVMQSLEQLIAVEDTCSKILKDKKEEALELIKEFQDRKKGLKGYGQPGDKSSRFSQEG